MSRFHGHTKGSSLSGKSAEFSGDGLRGAGNIDSAGLRKFVAISHSSEVSQQASAVREALPEYYPCTEAAKNSKKDLVFSEYRREYKRHFARIRAGKISEKMFFTWAKKHECDAERISLDEFKAWLKNS